MGQLSMLQSQQIRQAPSRRERITRQIRKPYGEVTMILWTPLTPRQIADAMMPFMLGRSGRPVPRGGLGEKKMRIQRFNPMITNYPRLSVEYERISDGTILFCRIDSLFDLRIPITVVLVVAALILGIATSGYEGIIIVAIGIAIAYGLHILEASVQQTAYREAAHWYLRGLVSTLSAEVVEAPT